jgi:hypothetical protein
MTPRSTMSARLLIPLVSLLCACGPYLYKGRGLNPDEQPARVRTEDKETQAAVLKLYITKVDGVSSDNYPFCWDSAGCWAKEAVLSSGRHHLSLRWQASQIHATRDVWFDAEAGVDYLVRQHAEGYEVRIWIEDTRTGKHVGGVASSEP